MQREHPDVGMMREQEGADLITITKIYRRQADHFRTNDVRESIPDRIVSISKPYIRPIVRGKETKSVEFGAKSNNIQVDGISFIEKLSFNAFNEGCRLSHCITLHKRLFDMDLKYLAGNNSYSGNENRNLCREKNIETNFAQKGRKSADHDGKEFIRKELARGRATSMEGSFGTQKEHYYLRKILSLTRKTEILYIFLSIHTANLVLLANRIEEMKKTA